MDVSYEIFFQRPIFHLGLNVAIRTGHKWMRVNIDDWLVIKETGKNDGVANGRIAGKALLPMRLIPEEILKNYHDPSCRSLPELMEEMKRIYVNFLDVNIVTILFFRIYDLPKKLQTTSH